MKKTVLAVLTILVTLALVGIVSAKDLEMTKKAGEYTVMVKIDRNPPVVGKNNMKIEIRDSGDKSMTDAQVTVDYSMPAMPGMPPMNYKTRTTLSGNEYRAAMDLSMSGPWSIAVKIARGGKTTTARFSIDAQ